MCPGARCSAETRSRRPRRAGGGRAAGGIQRSRDRPYPEARGIVAEARVQRWPLGNVFARPGRHLLQAPIEGALGPVANIHLAGDYFAELGNLEMAAKTGAAAAERVEALLGATPSHAHEAVLESVR